MKYYSDDALHAQVPEETLYEFLWKNNKDYLDETALNYFGQKFTYSELFKNIDMAAKAFLAVGVKQGDVCTIVSLSCVSSVVCFYALNRIGAVSNYINVLSSQEDLEIYFRDAESKFVVTLDLFGEKVLSAAKKTGIETVIVHSLSEYMPMITKVAYTWKTRTFDATFLSDPIVVKWKDFLSQTKVAQIENVKKTSDSLCCLAHTGRTTGFPKTVFISDKALNILAQQYDKTIVHERQQVFLSVMIPFVVYGILTNIHMPLCLGLQTVLIPKFDASQWADYIKKYRPAHICAVPSYIAPMLENKKMAKMDLSCFVTVGLGGDGLNIPLEENINRFFTEHNSSARVIKGYGMTEVCSTFSVCNHLHNKIGSVGFPFPSNNLMIYDNDLNKELSYGEIGEICIQSASCMMGYKNHREELEQLFRIHQDGSRWIHTGDLGYIDKNGFLFLSGRMKRIILTTQEGVAYKVFPNIIEDIINTHVAVLNSCVVGMKNGNDQILKIYITLLPEYRIMANEIEQQLRKTCEKNLSEWMRPYFYEFRNELPLTSAGKVDYMLLEKDVGT